MNEIIQHKSWFSKNRIWLFPLILLLVSLIILVLNSKIGKTSGDVVKAYTDTQLYEKAINVAQQNEEVRAVLGELKPLDELAILEGSVIYSENYNSVELHCRINGSKGKGKLDVYADRKGNNWDYMKIRIRIKQPKQTIQVLNKQ